MRAIKIAYNFFYRTTHFYWGTCMYRVSKELKSRYSCKKVELLNVKMLLTALIVVGHACHALSFPPKEDVDG